MKTLHLIRHAKSSWTDSSLKDEQRPLKNRGINDCKLMPPALSEHKSVIGRIFCSPAQRAQSTIKTFLTHTNTNTGTNLNWSTDKDLYTFRAYDLLKWWQHRNDAFNHITQVGHNPGMPYFIEHLKGESIRNLSTCGYTQLIFNGHHWSNSSADSCQLATFITPNQLKYNWSQHKWIQYP